MGNGIKCNSIEEMCKSNTMVHLVALYKIGLSGGVDGLVEEVDKYMRALDYGDVADSIKNGTYKGQ